MIKSRLRIKLAEKEMNQLQLSQLTGIRENTISMIINNKIQRIPVEAIDKFCEVFNCDVGDLFYHIKENKKLDENDESNEVK